MENESFEAYASNFIETCKRSLNEEPIDVDLISNIDIEAEDLFNQAIDLDVDQDTYNKVYTFYRDIKMLFFCVENLYMHHGFFHPVEDDKLRLTLKVTGTKANNLMS